MPGGSTDRDDRGQVGTGTLVVFVALVLVAAVAAGVLVDASGHLQSRAADTGSQAQAGVSNRVEIVSVVGADRYEGNPNPTELGRNGEIDTIDVYVTLSPGAEAVDLSEATVQYTTDGESATLTYSRGTSFNEDTFIVAGFDADGYQGPATELNATGELYRITIRPDSELAGGAEASIEIVDQSGASTAYEIDVPAVVDGTYEQL